MKYPVLLTQPHFYEGGIEKPLSWSSMTLIDNEWFKDLRAIDSDGYEWLISDVRVIRYTNFLQYFKRQKYRNVKVEYIFKKGKEYSLEQLKNEIQEFMIKNRLRGQPFENKRRDVPRYMEQFNSIKDFTSKKWLMDK